MTVRSTVGMTICAVVCWSLLAAGYAGANFPGANGKIAFVEQTLTGSAVQSRILTMDPDGSDINPLTGPGKVDLFPAYSADGEKIVFVRISVTPPSSVSSSIWVMNHDGSNATQLTSEEPDTLFAGPQFSPDGSQIVFGRQSAGGPGDPRIFIMNSDGSGERHLTSGLSPSFSPDGQKIVFAGSEPGTGFVGISTMNPDGSEVTPLTSGSPSQADDDPDYSPDGRRIVFERYSLSGSSTSSRLIVMEADGSNQSLLVSPQGDSIPLQPVFSPDGTRVAFTRTDQTSSTPSFRIELADSTGTDQGLTPLTDASTLSAYPAWQPLNAPACDLAGASKQKSVKKISLTATCHGENASVVAEGTGQAPKVPKAGAVTSKKKRFTLPAVTIQVPAGAPATLTLKVPKKGRNALKKATKAGKKGRVAITATFTDDLGQSATETFAVKIKPRKK